MRPHVSICIPAYEEPALLARALHSVFKQSFADYEVIVTDDSVSFAVEAAISQWLSDPRMKYIRNDGRLGSPENWNRAVEHARGDLIKVLHHDDWFSYESSLGQFVELIEKEPSATFAFSASSAREVGGRELFQHTPSARQLEALKKDPRCLFKANFVGAPSATIFRRDGDFRFDPHLKWLVDVDAYIRLLKDGASFQYSAIPMVNITISSPRQVTREIEADPALQFVESAYLYNSLGFKGLERIGFLRLFVDLTRRIDSKGLDAVASDSRVKDPPLEVQLALFMRRLYLRLRRFLAAGADLLGLRRDTTILARTSYSQCGEDLIIDFLFMWLGVTEISYLDIGANHPIRLNNTYFFYLRGCKGVLIEPDSDLYKVLVAARPRDRCLNIAVGVDGNPTAKMFIMTSRTLNTLVPSQATEYESFGREKTERIVEVPQRGINEVLAAEFQRTPNLVSLDVEGLDLEILKQWDFASFRPEVFCIETLTFTQNGTERKLTEIIEFMRARGYMQYADTYINTVFVSTDAWNSRRA